MLLGAGGLRLGIGVRMVVAVIWLRKQYCGLAAPYPSLQL